MERLAPTSDTAHNLPRYGEVYKTLKSTLSRSNKRSAHLLHSHLKLLLPYLQFPIFQYDDRKQLAKVCKHFIAIWMHLLPRVETATYERKTVMLQVVCCILRRREFTDMLLLPQAQWKDPPSKDTIPTVFGCLTGKERQLFYEYVAAAKSTVMFVFDKLRRPFVELKKFCARALAVLSVRLPEVRETVLTSLGLPGAPHAGFELSVDEEPAVVDAVVKDHQAMLSNQMMFWTRIVSLLRRMAPNDLKKYFKVAGMGIEPTTLKYSLRAGWWADPDFVYPFMEEYCSQIVDIAEVSVFCAGMEGCLNELLDPNDISQDPSAENADSACNPAFSVAYSAATDSVLGHIEKLWFHTMWDRSPKTFVADLVHCGTFLFMSSRTRLNMAIVRTLQNTNGLCIESTTACLGCIKTWLCTLRDCGAFVTERGAERDGVDVDTMLTGLYKLLDTDHFQILMQTIVFVYDIASCFRSRARLHFLDGFLFYAFDRLLCHWSEHVRVCFHHLLAFRIARLEEELKSKLIAQQTTLNNGIRPRLPASSRGASQAARLKCFYEKNPINPILGSFQQMIQSVEKVVARSSGSRNRSTSELVKDIVGSSADLRERMSSVSSLESLDGVDMGAQIAEFLGGNRNSFQLQQVSGNGPAPVQQVAFLAPRASLDIGSAVAKPRQRGMSLDLGAIARVGTSRERSMSHVQRGVGKLELCPTTPAIGGLSVANGALRLSVECQIDAILKWKVDQRIDALKSDEENEDNSVKTSVHRHFRRNVPRALDEYKKVCDEYTSWRQSELEYCGESGILDVTYPELVIPSFVLHELE